MDNYKLCSLSFKTTTNYDENLQTLLNLINKTQRKSLIVAPEVCLTGFDYENYDKALDFAQQAEQKIKEASKDKIIILTMLEKDNSKIYNFAKIFYNGKIVHKQAKARLFKFGDEHKYMQEGKEEDIKIINIDGIKIAILICFELRFKDLWKKVEGADVIATPSYWGVLRTKHFEAITQTLAIINQCFVVASDSLNDDCTKMSGIIKPDGEVFRNGNKPCLKIDYNKKDIQTMRRYMDVGIG